MPHTTPPTAAPRRRFTLIGSSHLFGLKDEFVGELPNNAVKIAWETGVPVTGEIDLGGLPAWQGQFVMFNTPAAGPPPQIKDGVLYVPPQLPEVLSHIAADTQVIFSLMRGQEFAIASLVDDPGHADFFGDDGGFEPGRAWISRADASDWLRGVAEPLLATHLTLRQQFPAARIVHVCPPPPIEDEAHIRANAEGFGALFAAHGVKPFAMRLRMYRLMYAELNAQLARHGVFSLSAPADALTPAGGLRAELARGCLHGNQAYAQLLAAQIREVLNVASV
jgi:hypothetical protein